METDLGKEFKEAFDKMSKLEKVITPDLQLNFYAYYKQATIGNQPFSNNEPNVRNAFKFNAWIQLKGMSSDDAKREYIKLAKTVLNNKK